MGMPLRTRIFAWIMDRSATPIEEADNIAELRSQRSGVAKTRGGRFIFGSEDSAANIEDQVVDIEGRSIRLRIYRPRGTNLPVVVNFHGGGWVLGEPEQSGWLASRVAVQAGVVVISVQYRLAPENPYPAAVEDCWAATTWIHDHAVELGVDAGRMAVMGDSAGGNLAAVVSLLARDAGAPVLRKQVLIYPAVEMYEKWPSELRNADAPVLTSRNMHAFSSLYLQDADGTEFTASPIRATSHKGLAPALIVTAEHDPLLDNGSRYQAVLEDAGVPVAHTTYGGAVHGFLSLPGVTTSAEPALEQIVAELRVAF